MRYRQGKLAKARDLRPTSDPESLEALARLHLEWMRVRAYSAGTLRGRQDYLAYFFDWCHERGIARPSEITRPILQRYQRWLFYYRKRSGAPLGVQSQAIRLTALRCYFKWLVQSGHLLYNPAADLELPRGPKRLPREVWSPSEIEAVIAQVPLDDALALRDRAILETLYSTGIRRTEAVGLSIYDVDYERRTLFVREGKGAKDRVVPIGERALLWVDRYLRELRPKLVLPPDGGALFLTREGEPFRPDSFANLVRGFVRSSGVGKEGACHLFRHSMATAMLENGADIRYVQEMLGHASCETTQIYTRVTINKLRQVHAATHPARLERTSELRAELLCELDEEAERELEGDGAQAP